MELTLRSLAAAVHLKKTGDAESADRNRGLVAPGDEIAPSWVNDSSMEYSRVVHRQRTYLYPPSGVGKHQPAAGGKGEDDKDN